MIIVQTRREPSHTAHCARASVSQLPPIFPMPNPYDPPKANVLDPQSARKVSRPVALAANTIFRRTLDGRIIFTPWGRFGACYLPDQQQQLRRARIQAAFGGLGLAVTVASLQFLSTAQVFGVVLPLQLAFQCLLFALYARGLPRTDPPAAPTSREQRWSIARKRFGERSRLMGKPMLWTMLVLSLLFVLGGMAIAAMGGPLTTAAEAILFFGACAVVFVLQLRSF